MASVRIISVGPLQGSSTQTSQHFLEGGRTRGWDSFAQGHPFKGTDLPCFSKFGLELFAFGRKFGSCIRARAKETTPHLLILPQRKAGKEVKALGLPRRPRIGVPMSHLRAIGVKLQI